MRNAMEILDIIRRIVARKRAARKEPVFALFPEILAEYVAAGGTDGLSDKLAALEEQGVISSHRTATSRSYGPVEEEEDEKNEKEVGKSNQIDLDNEVFGFEEKI